MSWRTKTGVWIFAFIAAGLFFDTTAASAQATDPNPDASENEIELRFADYETRLNAILKTRRLEEQQFVNEVLQLVRAGELPIPLMESSFMWVLKNRPDTPYPFIYFERVLRLQAELAEVEIPEFDYAVYSQRVQNRRTN